MGITLDELIYDPANADTSANVGAHLRAGTDGTPIAAVGDALKVELGATSLAALENINVTVDNEVEITNDTGNPIPVSATDLDIRDLNHAQDNVAIAFNGFTAEVDALGRLKVIDDDSITAIQEISVLLLPYENLKNSANSIGTTAELLTATALTGRQTMLIQNLGNQDLWIGTSTVTPATGVKVPKGASAEFKFSDLAAVYGVTSSGTADVRILELSS